METGIVAPPLHGGAVEEDQEAGSEAHKKAYKLLVLRREIRFAKEVLRIKQAELKMSLTHKRRRRQSLPDRSVLPRPPSRHAGVGGETEKSRSPKPQLP